MPAATTLASELTLPAGQRVVIAGCDLGGALAVGRITIPATSTVRWGGVGGGAPVAQQGLGTAPLALAQLLSPAHCVPAQPMRTLHTALTDRLQTILTTGTHTVHTTHTHSTHNAHITQLIIADQPLLLSFKSISVQGALRLGAQGCPLASNVTLFSPGGDAANGIDVAKGGTLGVHGTVLGPTWTRVSQTVR